MKRTVIYSAIDNMYHINGDGKLPKYHHLKPSGRLYAYYYPQYYAWAKRKTAGNK